ncbi:carboxymuconolactone decarboxylase family protein [Actinoplanes sp. NPDC023936]|uniref:carboxymuconolactone decarboxylase family protein n=1 Tax=Actinoplanes sp. NPDC023936 TaxID=3154910 RepID=UPI00340BD660
MAYRFFAPPPARAATGRAAQVYQQMRDDFPGPAPTFHALSVAPDVMAATWALMRESLLANRDGRSSDGRSSDGPSSDSRATPHRAGDGASRVDREVVAAAVSRANDCRFCADAHVTLLHGLGEHDLAETIARGGSPPQPAQAELAGWARASRHPRATGWTSRYNPQLTGTLLAFHFINRVVSALLAPDLLPGGLQRSSTARAAGGRLLARSLRTSIVAGRSLPLLDVANGPPPAWAGNDPVGAAWVALRDATARGGDLLGDLARHTVTATVRWEDGGHPADPVAWAGDLVRDLPAKERVGARIALLAAFAPEAITAGDIGLWRLTHRSDADLVRLVAYGAITATEHVAQALDPAPALTHAHDADREEPSCAELS